MTTGDAPVLRMSEVDLVRDGNLLLDAVSLTVRAGEHWALLGANGAGKSTMLSLLGAQVHPTRGRVEVLGRRLGRVDLRWLRTQLGHVDPRHRPGAPLSLLEVVLTGVTNTVEPVPRWRPSDAQLARARQLVDDLGLRHRVDARWPTLSQGERGRALIARALVAEPKLLLLDEPATGLDLAAREQLLESLDALRHTDPWLSTVLVTHHLEELPASTTHAALIRAGRLVAAGPVAEVLRTEPVSACFDHPIRIDRVDGRWTARAGRSVAPARC
ncbi:ATP-binding cassette domain-containing protein [Actinocatenispora sera]|uniref:ABC transporter ATP-binding protein n=1 Tax=Actinocatenispora sera TaxID=390989 RepID=UPI0033DDFCD3